MRDSQMTNGLAMRWAPVVDERVRTHLEARWVATTDEHAPVHATHAA